MNQLLKVSVAQECQETRRPRGRELLERAQNIAERAENLADEVYSKLSPLFVETPVCENKGVHPERETYPELWEHLRGSLDRIETALAKIGHTADRAEL